MGYWITASVILAQILLIRMFTLLDDHDPDREAYELQEQANYLRAWEEKHSHL